MSSSRRDSAISLLNEVLDGQYKLLSLVGEGEMGAVFEAEVIKTSHTGPEKVAVKILHEDLGHNPALRERFEREARALFGLEHLNILRVHDFGVVRNAPYLVMELLEGQTLDSLVEERPLPPEAALSLASQLLEGLAHAHDQGVLHRDLKTENVFVSKDQSGAMVAKLLDFGLVKFVDDDRWGASTNKLTVQGTVFGTPAYMAPEQCGGAPTDERSDVYSAGVMLFELFTGEWPFMEETRMDMFRSHLTVVPDLLNVRAQGIHYRPELEQLVAKAMAKKPDDRFQNAGQMLAALRAVARPINLRRPSTSTTKKPMWLGLACVAIVAIGLAAYLFTRAG